MTMAGNMVSSYPKYHVLMWKQFHQVPIATEQQQQKVIKHFSNILVETWSRQSHQSLRNLSYSPQMLSQVTLQALGWWKLVKLTHSKKFLSVSHRIIRSDMEVGKGWFFQGLKTAQGKL